VLSNTFQPKTTSFGSVRPVPKLVERKPEQCRKAEPPIDVTAGKLTEIKTEHLSKASFSIVVTAGKLTDTKEVQL
jgi:hypothetical protein